MKNKTAVNWEPYSEEEMEKEGSEKERKEDPIKQQLSGFIQIHYLSSFFV